MRPSLSKYLSFLIKTTKQLGWLFTPVAFVFIGYLSWQSRSSLQVTFASINIHLVIVSIILWVALHIVAALFSKTMLNGLGASLRFQNAFVIYANRLPAKYIPGGIWHTVARASDYSRHKIAKQTIAAYFAIENLTALLVTFCLGGSLLYFIQSMPEPLERPLALLASTAGILILGLPWMIKRYSPASIRIPSRQTFASGLALALLLWSLAGAAFASFMLSFSHVAAHLSVLQLAGAYLVSWGVGFIALFAPQGIGVTEYVASELLAGALQPSTLLTVLASFRLIILSADILTWLLAKLLLTRPRK